MNIKTILALPVILILLAGCAAPDIAKDPNPQREKSEPVKIDTPPKDPMRDIGRQFLEIVSRKLPFVKDAEVISLVNDLGKELVMAAGSKPDHYHFFVVRKNEINAFAVPGGYIFIYDGLLRKLDSLDSLAGVLAHEIAHVERDHHFRDSQKIALADLATLAGVIIGSAGNSSNPDATIAIGSSANIAYKLKLSREHEQDADLLALRYLRGSRYNPSGLVEFFARLSRYESLNMPDILPAYLSTHPGVNERLVVIESLIKDLPLKILPAAMVDRLERVKIILKAQAGERLDLSFIRSGDESDERNHYLRGLYALYSGDFNNAISEYKVALDFNPSRARYHADLATGYMHSENMDMARIEAMESIRLSGEYESPFITLGLAAKEADRYDEAVRQLGEALRRNPYNSLAHYHISASYHAINMPSQGRYHMGQYFRLNMDKTKAARQFMMALEESQSPEFTEKIKDALYTLMRDGI